MIVGIMILEIHSGTTHSLKEKRQVIRSLKEKLRRRFNVAVIESGYQDSWQRAQVAVVTASGSRPVLDGLLSRVEDFVAEAFPGISVQVEREYL